MIHKIKKRMISPEFSGNNLPLITGPWKIPMIIALSLSVIFAGAQIRNDPFAQAKWRNAQLLKHSDRDMVPEQVWYDVISYSINAEIFPSSETVNGSVIIEIQPTIANVVEIVLDAADHLIIDEISSVGFTSYDHSADRLHLFFDNPLPIDEIRSIEIDYHGDTNSGYIWSGGITYYGGYFWSLGCPYGLHKWVPCKDHPSDKAEWIDLQLTAPSQYVVASNGSLLDVIDNGNGTSTHHWLETYAIATYLFCINAYNYNVYTEYFEYGDGQTMPIIYYVPGTLPSGFQYVETALPIFSELFGLYPFVDEKFAIARVTNNFGAMEHQTCVTTSVTSGMTMVHELAHQWFGDLVTPVTWQHGWLNEGFAVYSEAIYIEETQGTTAYHTYMNGIDWTWDDNRTLFTADTTDFSQIFNNIIYDKGAWVCHMMRKVVGTDNWFEAVRDYLDIYAFSNVYTEDLQAVMEEHFGDDLDWFFQEWVYWNGHPDYEYQWASTTDTFFMVVDQSNTGDGPGLFTMPVEFGLGLADGNTIIETFWIEGETSSFNVPVPATVTSVTCDPDNWLLNDASGSGTYEFALGEPQLFVDDEDDNGFIDPGELFQLDVQITNLGIPFDELVGVLICDAPGVEIISGESIFPAAGLGVYTTNITPFEIQLANPFDPQVVEFSLLLTWNEYVDTVLFNIALGTPDVLVINATDNPELTASYSDALVSAQQVVYIWDEGSAMTLAELIPNFQHILYFAGDNYLDPVPEDVQTLLTEHCASEKNLLVMGQNIGNSIGSTEFYQNVLHADYQGEHEGYVIYGNDNHPVIQGANILVNHPPECDMLIPLNLAEMAYEYSGSYDAAGIISDESGKLLYMGFDLSDILGTGGWGQSPAEFINMVMDWFQMAPLPGDVNQDENLDILDVVVTVNIIMGNIEPTDYQQTAADMNEDDVINVLDIILMVNIILGI